MYGENNKRPHRLIQHLSLDIHFRLCEQVWNRDEPGEKIPLKLTLSRLRCLLNYPNNLVRPNREKTIYPTSTWSRKIQLYEHHRCVWGKVQWKGWINVKGSLPGLYKKWQTPESKRRRKGQGLKKKKKKKKLLVDMVRQDRAGLRSTAAEDALLSTPENCVSHGKAARDTVTPTLAPEIQSESKQIY